MMERFNDEERFLSALKIILNGIDAYLYVSDIQTSKILFINDRLKEHFNLGEDVVGHVCWNVFHKGLGQKCDFCPICQLLENPETDVVWEKHDSRTGRFYKNTSRIIEWLGGEKVHLLQATDITDSKLAEASLKKRLKQQELMSDISQSFTTMEDTGNLMRTALETAGEFMGVNQAFLSKYQKDESCLECQYEWYDTDGQPFLGDKYKWPITPDMEIYKNLTQNGYAAVNDYALLTHANFQTVRDYDLRAFLNIPIEVSGNLWGVLGFIINKKTYDWSESDIHLGKMIAGVFSGAVRRNIAEEDLIKAKEVAELASRAKGDFLSSMSHEMRTPMNAIIGMTRIAQDSSDPPKMEYCLERIDNASKQLLGLINDILDISKIEADKLALSPAAFDFERMLMNIADVINFRVDEKKQHLIVNIDKKVPHILIGDEMRLSQVILNLLSNSVKFTPEGGTIMLNIHVIDTADGISKLRCEIVDNGIGISKEQQAKLFMPFEQADGGIVRKYGGTGLGLTISKGIVELMGGRIWIESKLGQGAKFSFIVKLKYDKWVPWPELDRTICKDDIRILVVEEIPVLRNYFLHVIPEFGLSCDVADSASAALKMIAQKKRNPYNIFFIDCIMPHLEGIKLTKKIKNMNHDHTVTIMVSATDWNIIEKEATAAGADRFVFKPIFPSTLVHAINESMGVISELKSVPDTTPIYNFNDHTLLVAEDIEINREIVFALLEDTQISIDFAQDGAEALSMFENNPKKYSLILMDIQMPEMDGHETTQKIRALNQTKAKQIPIIAMTASVFREDIEKCLLVGMNDHIGKPIDTEKLLEKLDKWL